MHSAFFRDKPRPALARLILYPCVAAIASPGRKKFLLRFLTPGMTLTGALATTLHQPRVCRWSGKTRPDRSDHFL